MADKHANPAPLGLIGFGMTTVLLSLHNTGLFEICSMILCMGIFCGGLAQIITGIMEYRNGDTFNTTAFIAYGLFWLSLVGLTYLNGRLGIPENSPGHMAAYLFIWGLFTCFMWIGSWTGTRDVQTVFFLLMTLFWMLAARDAFGWTGVWAVITGIEGVACGASAIYSAMAQILNENYGRVILPRG